MQTFELNVEAIGKNGDFETYKQGVGTAVAYAWFVWEKGYRGQPTVGWI